MPPPGVVVTTGAVAGPSTPTLAPSAAYFVVGLAERGSTTRAVTVSSLADFERQFGSRTVYGYLYDDVATFFQEGGTRAIVARVVGPAATTGALSSPLQDRAGTPAATLNVTASSPGAWSSSVSVKVIDGGAPGTFRLQVYLGGVLIEDHVNLRSPQEAVSKVNARSTYVRLSDAGSATAAPNNNPAVTANPVALTAGTDDRASVTATHYLAALTRFEKGLGDGAVAIPGIGTSVHAGLLTHAKDNNRLALLAGAAGADKATLIGLASAIDSRWGGLFAPWIRVPDPYGGTRVIPPDGFVAAARARAHTTVGPWKAAAGLNSRAAYVVTPDQEFSVADAGELDDNKVNVIRTIAGAVRLYGWRSLSADADNWAYLTGVDVINRIVTEAERQLEDYVFGVIDSSGHLLATVRGTLIGIVAPMAAAGGLFARLNPLDGSVIDPGYAVSTDETLNPVSSLALNQIVATVGVRVVPTAALIQLYVTKAAVTAAL